MKKSWRASRVWISFSIAALLRLLDLQGTPGVQISGDPPRFTLQTNSGSTILAVSSDGSLLTVHEGMKGDLADVTSAEVQSVTEARRWGATVPVRGGFPVLAPALEVSFPQGVRGLRLVYSHHSVTQDEEGRAILRVGLKDEAYPVLVTLFFRVFPELDLLERWLEVKNLGLEPLRLENAASASLLLDQNSYQLTHLSGRWGHEFSLERTLLTGGAKVLDVRGMRFHHLSPWYLVRPAEESEEDQGSVWFGTLAWSGNWSLRFERTPTGELQIVGGINFWDTVWTISSGETFTSPVMTTGYCREGPGGASRRLHRYIRRHVLPASNRDKPRPVLYNSWYATTFGVHEKQQIELARIAEKIGVELFVMDDGWFQGRKDAHAGLGDWTPDPDKFPEGLGPMISQMEGMGLDFGLWVEPEMVNPDSDLYRAHPDWALRTPGRVPLESRNQLVLNMARPDVKDFTLDWIHQLLESHSIRFLKWDYNRDQAEVDWPGVPEDRAREIRIRYVEHLYEIYQEMRQRFPDLLVEGCAGGGGRVDAGILKYVDQVWTSDNTNPADRLFIQYGFSQAFPAKIMVSWTTDDDWRGARPSLEYRFRVAMSGVLGVGNDLTTWDEREIEIARREISRYKIIRDIIQEGDLYRLASPFDSDQMALCYVAEDRAQAALLMYNLQVPLPGTRVSTRKSSQLRLKGLDPAIDYAMDFDYTGTASGRRLMDFGLPWLPRGDYQAKVVRLVATEKD